MRPRAWRRLWFWTRSIADRGRLVDDMEEEIRFHLENRAQDLEREGIAPVEARRQARMEFGGAATHKDDVRRVLGVRWWDELCSDLRYGVRGLRNSPGFAAIAIGSLALAIGANTTAFSVANRLLNSRLHVGHPEQLRLLLLHHGEHSVVNGVWGDWSDNVSDTLSYPVYEAMRGTTVGGRRIFGFKGYGPVSARVGSEPLQLDTELVSGDFYEQMQLTPMLGRPITPADDRVGAPCVAVISYGMWQKHFGGVPDVIGRQIYLGGVPVTVVGVNPRAYGGATGFLQPPDMDLPIAMMRVLRPNAGKDDPLTSASLWWINAMVRVERPAAAAKDIAGLQTAFDAAVRGTSKIASGETVPALLLENGSQGLPVYREFVRQPVHFLLGFVALVLLLACANVANLMLARATARQREMSVRLALGASRGRVLRQLLTESLFLAGIAGALGLLLGYPLRNVLNRGMMPPFMATPWNESAIAVPFDWRVFGFTAAVTVFTAVVFGLLPAWRSMRTEASTVMKEATRNATRRRSGWSGRGVVAVQLALSTVLVIGAAVFTRALLHLTAINPGFDAKNLLVFAVSPAPQTYPEGKDIALHTHLEEELSRVPGVEGVSAVRIPLLSGSMWNGVARIEGQTKKEADGAKRYIDLLHAGPEFLHVMNIPLLRGRDLNARDSTGAPQAAVINQLMAETYFPHADPLGKRFSIEEDEKGNAIWVTVVGVCANTHYESLAAKRPPIAILPYRQQKSVGSLSYMVRSRELPDRLVPALRRVVADVDPNLPVTDVRTELQQIAAGTRQQRTFAALAASFGLLALLLACVGVYGVMAYTVSQRTNEIGIRLALGAQRAQVRGMVLREAAWLAVTGVICGLAGAAALGRLVRALLYGVTATDPASFAGRGGAAGDGGSAGGLGAC